MEPASQPDPLSPSPLAPPDEEKHGYNYQPSDDESSQTPPTLSPSPSPLGDRHGDLVGGFLSEVRFPDRRYPVAFLNGIKHLLGVAHFPVPPLLSDVSTLRTIEEAVLNEVKNGFGLPQVITFIDELLTEMAGLSASVIQEIAQEIFTNYGHLSPDVRVQLFTAAYGQIQELLVNGEMIWDDISDAIIQTAVHGAATDLGLDQ